MVRKNEINPVWVFEEGIPTDLNAWWTIYMYRTCKADKRELVSHTRTRSIASLRPWLGLGFGRGLFFLSCSLHSHR